MPRGCNQLDLLDGGVGVALQNAHDSKIQLFSCFWLCLKPIDGGLLGPGGRIQTAHMRWYAMAHGVAPSNSVLHVYSISPFCPCSP